MSISRRRTQSGLTLIELVMFIVIVSAALAGILSVLNLTMRHSADPLQRKQALAIAEALLEEARLSRFTYCDPTDSKAEEAASAADCTIKEDVGPETGNSRPFDNVNDYVTAYGVPQTAFNSGGVLTDVTGAALPVPGYTATLTVTPEALNGVNSDNSLRISVTVSYGSESITLDGYRTRYAPRAVP